VVGQDNVVSIATHYMLVSLGIKYWCGQDSSPPSILAMGPIKLPVKWEPGLFSEGKAARVWH
jgi:hypothetical protein